MEKMTTKISVLNTCCKNTEVNAELIKAKERYGFVAAEEP